MLLDKDNNADLSYLLNKLCKRLEVLEDKIAFTGERVDVGTDKLTYSIEQLTETLNSHNFGELADRIHGLDYEIQGLVGAFHRYLDYLEGKK